LDNQVVVVVVADHQVVIAVEWVVVVVEVIAKKWSGSI
jgi:hypothetical protein